MTKKQARKPKKQGRKPKKPGPWRIGDPTLCEAGLEIIVDESYGWIAEVIGSSPEEAETNSRLIAAAPDLLEALQDALLVLELRNHATSHATRGEAKAFLDQRGAAVIKAKAAINQTTEEVPRLRQKLFQLTEWEDSSTFIKSGKGLIGYKDWLKLELKRILAGLGRKAEIRTDETGCVSLWVNRHRHCR